MLFPEGDLINSNRSESLRPTTEVSITIMERKVNEV
jgi:hypothetical protein